MKSVRRKMKKGTARLSASIMVICLVAALPGNVSTVKAVGSFTPIFKTTIANVAITDIDAPAVDVALDTSASCNTSRVSSTEPVVTWTPAHSTAECNTSYTASVTLSAVEDEVFDDNAKATVNGNEASSVRKNEDGTLTVTYTFPATKDKLLSITEPQPITIANGTAYDEMNLPETVGIVTVGNTETTAMVSWDTTTPALGSYDPNVLTEQRVALNGTVTCPDTVYTDGVSLTTIIYITVSAADTEKKTLSPGDFKFTAPSGLVYDGTAKRAAVSSELAGLGNITVKYYCADGTELASAPVDAGTYIVKIDVAEGDEYYAVSDLTADDWVFTIASKEIIADDLEFVDSTITKEYDGTTASTAKVQIKAGVIGTDAVEISGSAVYDSADAGTDKTLIFIPYAVTNENYTIAATEIVEHHASITKKTVMPAVEVTGTYSYAGTEITPAFAVIDRSVNEVLAAGRDYTYELSDNVNAGTAKITVKPAANGNYTFADVEKAFSIGKVTPVISVTAEPSSDIAGKTIKVTVRAENPNNSTLTDVPKPVLTYKVGENGTETEFADSFVIPEGTANGTIITITATIEGNENYYAETCTATVTVTDCLHTDKTTVWGKDSTSHWHICNYCGAVVDKEAHSYDSGVITTPATEEADGVMTYTCTVCGATKAEAIPAEGHDWSKWTVTTKPTLEADGTAERICNKNNEHKETTTVPKLSDTSVWTPTDRVEPTENTDGSQKYVSDEWGEIIITIPATGDPDAGKLEKGAEVEENAPIEEAVLDNKEDELLDADGILTPDEKAEVTGGKNVRVWLEISKTDETGIADTDKAAVLQAAKLVLGDNAELVYFDVDLFKQLEGGAKTKITEPGMNIQVTVKIPDTLLNHDKTILREYKIIRLHNGEVTVISGDFDMQTREFSFETDKFSTYAIAYSDKQLATGITLTPQSATLSKKGETLQLTATVTPDNVADKSVTWSSDNPSVATVDANGLVTAAANGTAVITATTADGGKTASSTIVVRIPENDGNDDSDNNDDGNNDNNDNDNTNNTATEQPNVPDNPVKPEQPDNKTESPKTGDNSSPAFWTILMLMSMTALAGLFAKKRKADIHDER